MQRRSTKTVSWICKDTKKLGYLDLQGYKGYRLMQRRSTKTVTWICKDTKKHTFPNFEKIII